MARKHRSTKSFISTRTPGHGARKISLSVIAFAR
jgi:hypothetical protein